MIRADTVFHHFRYNFFYRITIKNRNVRIKNLLPCIFRKPCPSKVRPKGEGVTHQASRTVKPNTPPPKETLAYCRAMEHLKPVGQSESGHERTVWSLSCLKR